MSVPPVLSPKNQKSVMSSRPTPRPPLMALQSRWPGLLPWAVAALALVIGFTLGVLIMRHRHEGQKVVAAVNGTQITQDQLFTRLQEAGGQIVVHRMVEEELQLQYAAKKGLAPTPAQVEAKYDSIRKDPRFAPALLASGMSLEDYKRSLRVKLAQANVLTDKISVSDAEVRDFYNQQSDPKNPQAQFYRPATMTFRVIATGNQKLAQSALGELNNNTPFELVATEFSVDPSKDAGGLLSPLQRGRSPLSQNPALETALFNMKVGQLYGPVSFNKGWWVFRCEDKSPGQALPFDSIKNEAKLGAQIIKGTKLKGKDIAKDFQDFQRTSSLQAFWPLYQRAVTGR
jgi:foldase protein PrsA